jgi:hypothetical protein
MKTFLVAVVLGFVLSPGSLLRRNATHLTENVASKVDVSARVLFVDMAGFPARWKPSENNRQARLTMDANAKSCALSLPSPEGAWNVVWSNGLVSNPQGSWPSVEAMLSGACGVFMASSSKGDVKVALEHFLSSLKVNMKVSRLELVEREVVYAVGAAGERTAQYWIDKEDFSARGLRWADSAGVLWELRFKKSGGFFEAMELRREGQMALRLLAQSPKNR